MRFNSGVLHGKEVRDLLCYANKNNFAAVKINSLLEIILPFSTLLALIIICLIQT